MQNVDVKRVPQKYLVVWELNGMPSSLPTNPFALSDVGFFSAPTFVDIDNDGDADESDEYLHNRLGTIAKMDENRDPKSIKIE